MAASLEAGDSRGSTVSEQELLSLSPRKAAPVAAPAPAVPVSVVPCSLEGLHELVVDHNRQLQALWTEHESLRVELETLRRRVASPLQHPRIAQNAHLIGSHEAKLAQGCHDTGAGRGVQPLQSKAPGRTQRTSRVSTSQTNPFGGRTAVHARAEDRAMVAVARDSSGRSSHGAGGQPATMAVAARNAVATRAKAGKVMRAVSKSSSDDGSVDAGSSLCWSGADAAHKAASRQRSSPVPLVNLCGAAQAAEAECARDPDLYSSARSLMELGSSPEQKANALRDVEVALKRGAAPHSWQGPSTPLRSAVEAHCIELVRMLLRAQADPNESDDRAVSVLHGAAFDGQWDICRELLDARAAANVADRHGQTPLFFAPSRPVCELLCSSRADIQQTNHKGQSAVHFAGQAGLDEVLLWFSDRVDVALLELHDVHGATAAYYARAAGVRPEVVQRLCQTKQPAQRQEQLAPSPQQQHQDEHQLPSAEPEDQVHEEQREHDEMQEHGHNDGQQLQDDSCEDDCQRQVVQHEHQSKDDDDMPSPPLMRRLESVASAPAESPAIRDSSQERLGSGGGSGSGGVPRSASSLPTMVTMGTDSGSDRRYSPADLDMAAAGSRSSLGSPRATLAGARAAWRRAMLGRKRLLPPGSSDDAGQPDQEQQRQTPLQGGSAILTEPGMSPRRLADLVGLDTLRAANQGSSSIPGPPSAPRWSRRSPLEAASGLQEEPRSGGAASARDTNRGDAAFGAVGSYRLVGGRDRESSAESATSSLRLRRGSSSPQSQSVSNSPRRQLASPGGQRASTVSPAPLHPAPSKLTRLSSFSTASGGSVTGSQYSARSMAVRSTSSTGPAMEPRAKHLLQQPRTPLSGSKAASPGGQGQLVPMRRSFLTAAAAAAAAAAAGAVDPGASTPSAALATASSPSVTSKSGVAQWRAPAAGRVVHRASMS